MTEQTREQRRDEHELAAADPVDDRAPEATAPAPSEEQQAAEPASEDQTAASAASEEQQAASQVQQDDQDQRGQDEQREQDEAAEPEEPEEPEADPEQRAAADGRSPGQLLTALELAEGQRDEYLDALQRERAEFDNFRRRSAREAAGARAAGVGDLAQQLLDVLDDLDRTVIVAERSSDEGLAAGIAAIRRKLVDVLVAAGVERIDEAGVPFDATRHEAVQQVPAEEPLDEPEVAEVLRPGYVHGDRCLRAAMVAVRQ